MDSAETIVKRVWSPSSSTLDNNMPTIKIMSYNILDDTFICQNKYRYCPRDKLYMRGRHHRIVLEIAQIDPDIVCLQEVTRQHFDKNLQPDLKRYGYSGMHMSFMKTKDGLAMFYKRNTVELTEKKFCHAQNDILRCVQKLDNERDKTDIINLAHKSQGCLLAKFLHISSGKLVAIGNIHVSWTRFHLPGLSSFEAACAVHHLRKFSDACPFVLTGDFNSTPDFAPYHLMTTGKFDHSVDHWSTKPLFDLFPWDDNEGVNMTVTVPSQPLLKSENHPKYTPGSVAVDQKLTALLSDHLNTNTPLISAYKEIMGAEPITNIEADDWKGYVHELCLDFMWHSNSGLVPCKVLQVPSRDVLRRYNALPSQLMPSDHIAIATEFRLN